MGNSVPHLTFDEVNKACEQYINVEEQKYVFTRKNDTEFLVLEIPNDALTNIDKFVIDKQKATYSTNKAIIICNIKKISTTFGSKIEIKTYNDKNLTVGPTYYSYSIDIAYYYESDLLVFRCDGEGLRYHEDGRRLAEGIPRNGAQEVKWKLNIWLKDNTLSKTVICRYTWIGYKIGYWYEVNKDGILCSEGKYIYFYPNDSISRTYRHGLWKFYNSDGNLTSEGLYKRGYKNGLWRDYLEDGRIKISDYRDNVEYDSWYQN
jgi:antitoxin component YwqK of YwqJK toxin-antitoxin module